MKTVVLSPSKSSSVKSTTTTTTAMSSGESSYFPGCRRDTNCHCEICLASFNATLDLMPMSAQRSTLTKHSASKPRISKTPVYFKSSVLSTPPSDSMNRSFTASPPINSTAQMRFQEKKKKKKKKKRDLGFFGFGFSRWILGLSLILAVEFGFSWVVMEVLNPELMPEMVKSVAEKSWGFRDMNQKLEFLKNELQGLVEDEVFNCSSNDSMWEINQDGLLLNSRCSLYKSVTEEVSIWGWPLQTAGLLTSEFSSRSFTILSGRVTEWSDGKLSYSIRTTNNSWTQGKWSSSVVQFDPSTWVLEYKRSLVTENSRIFSVSLEFLILRLSRELKRMKRDFWLLSGFENVDSSFPKDIFKIPT